jgi:hypothetical protein
MAIPVGTIIAAGSGLFNSIFGGRSETPAEEFARWWTQWKDQLSPVEWQYLNAWVAYQQQKDFANACPGAPPVDQIKTRQRGAQLWAQLMVNDIQKKKNVAHCMRDWQSLNPAARLQEIKSIQSESDQQKKRDELLTENGFIQPRQPQPKPAAAGALSAGLPLAAIAIAAALLFTRK